eukprot:symbB.v1.2.027357.t3/scaffold2799.1/size70062/6
MAGWAVPVAALLSSVLADTTAPVLQIEDAQAFIFHILMTVRINEDGRIYCGALETATSYTPSIFQMTTGSGLVGYDSATVSAFSYVNLVVGVLVPSTTYDVFCYAEDLFLNGFTLAQVAGTKLTLATASGGDYTAPTFSYVSPTFVVESIAVSVYFQLNEDGTVWCVAKIDTVMAVVPVDFHPLVPVRKADSFLAPTSVSEKLTSDPVRGPVKRARRRRRQRTQLKAFLKKHRFSDVNEPQQYHSLFCFLQKKKEELYPLHMAVKLGDYEILRLLLQAGADASQRTSSGKTALDFLDESHEMVLLIRSSGFHGCRV